MGTKKRQTDKQKVKQGRGGGQVDESDWNQTSDRQKEVDRQSKSNTGGRPPFLRGFVYAYHSAAPGLNPKHTVYAFFNYNVEIGTVFDVGMRKARK